VSEHLDSSFHTRFEVLALAGEARCLSVLAGHSRDKAEKLALVIAELGMNAVRHGGGGGRLKLTVAAAGWTVEVEDDGAGMTEAVLADAGRSDHLGASGVRPPGDGLPSFGSGLACVRRLSSRLELLNTPTGGARVVATRVFFRQDQAAKGATP
jgi:signal transduction histidine kinase